MKKKLGLRVAATLERVISLFVPQRTITHYFDLRDDILRLMPWTIKNLAPLINPYLPNRDLLGNGYIAAMVQTGYFILIVFKQIRRDGPDYMISIAPLCFPQRPYPFGVTETAVLELAGIGKQKSRRYDNLAELDSSMQRLNEILAEYLSRAKFPGTKDLIEKLLDEAMARGTAVK